VIDLVAPAYGVQFVQNILFTGLLREDVGCKQKLRGSQLPNVEVMQVLQAIDFGELFEDLLAPDFLSVDSGMM